MSHVLEEVLPTRFGGSPLDYQLQEIDEDGYTRLILVVSPRVTIPDESEVIGALLSALREAGAAANVAGAFWQEGETFRVRSEEPHVTARGKQSLLVRRRSDRRQGSHV